MLHSILIARLKIEIDLFAIASNYLTRVMNPTVEDDCKIYQV